ncbi:DUF4326 domain-containing protein [Rhodococcus zopfii]|uniref:DUF4326 domain-containing protein n=1 Tax=Rhodococcus zopfii TaxID=43772 RepID=A0ABU3WXE6_9NOCA|nr:DUF4326 domain-containing protein [Rhodococcus zopfii]MDV2478593.1 DUF4326 domain-containing protein [Rhodococcus zopfii]
MRTPKRIQRQRTKGWRMPEGAMYVGRPTKWGNPYRVGDVNGFTGFDIKDAMDAVSVYAAELDVLRMFQPESFARLVGEIRTELAGRDLACWCPLDQPCHADVLLEIANGGAS